MWHRDITILKVHFLYFAICLTVILGCSSDDSGPVVQRIGEIEVFDVGNTGNSSDIRVRFTVENIGGVSEFRIMLVPTDALAAFDQRDAVRLSTDQYFPVEILTTDDTYSERLPEMLDVNGEAVQPDKKYGIRILSVGDQLTQLSFVESNEIELKDAAIYVGKYEGFMCCKRTGTSVGDGVIMKITGNEFSYQGTVETVPDINNVVWSFSVSFTVDKENISFLALLPVSSVVLGAYLCNNSEEEVQGSGNIVKDLAMFIDFPACESVALEDRERYINVRRVLEED